MSKYYHAKRDGKYHYEGLDTSKEAMPLEGVVSDFWNENYSGEKNSEKNRHGFGSVEWNLDETGQWRFEEWAKDQGLGPKHKHYDYDDKLNPDRKLRGIKIVFKGVWKNDYPHGDGKMFLNDKLFCEGTWKGGNLHGKAKFKFSLYTVSFGIYNNYIQIPGYSDLETEEEFIKLMRKDKELGTFEGEFKYGLANGYGELIYNNGLSYKGEWRNGFPYGKGIKTYEDGREESGEFGIINQGTLKLRTDYIEENRGQLIFGSRRFADGTDENVDKRTLYQTARSTIKDF